MQLTPQFVPVAANCHFFKRSSALDSVESTATNGKLSVKCALRASCLKRIDADEILGMYRTADGADTNLIGISLTERNSVEEIFHIPKLSRPNLVCSFEPVAEVIERVERPSKGRAS